MKRRELPLPLQSSAKLEPWKTEQWHVGTTSVEYT